MKPIREALSYDDITLKPRFSTIEHRSSIDISVADSIADWLTIPIIASPMDTITGAVMASTMARLGCGAVLHRYCTIEDQVLMFKEAITDLTHKEIRRVGCAIGASKDYLERAQALVAAGCSFICIDVAHADSAKVHQALFKANIPLDIHLMVGNIATRGAVKRLRDLDHELESLRVNIGSGSACLTRVNCGVGVPSITSIMDCSTEIHNKPWVGNIPPLTIADGGLRSSGDIVKALAAGADAVMIGGLLAGTDESLSVQLYRQQPVPSSRVTYRGMASKEAMKCRVEGTVGSVEGKAGSVPFKGPVKAIIEQLASGIKAGLFYQGAHTITELHTKAQFYKQTHAGYIEGTAHHFK